MSQPPDRSKILTEQRNPRSGSLHAMSVGDCVALIQQEDHKALDAVEGARASICGLIEDASKGFREGGRLIYVGAGTSGRLGVLDASEAPPTFCVDPGRVVGIIAGGNAALRTSSESREDDPHGAVVELLDLGLNGRDTVIGIAAGGTTAYVLGAIEYARARGVTTAIITCSPVEIDVDHTIFLDTGPEILTGSTRMKAGTATKLVLNTISTTVMVQTGRVYQNLMVDVKATNDKLRDRAARIVSELTGLDRSSAFSLLSKANGEVKTAVVMHRLTVDRETAAQRLADASGRLDAVLEP